MSRLFFWLLSLIGVAGAVFWGLTIPGRVAALPDHTPDRTAGAQVFAAGGCASCHAAPGARGDAKLILAGGLALETPFGTFRVPNISPHPEAGIGGWTMDDFVTAMMAGTSPGGQHYYPAFPYTSYAKMQIADVMDLKAYLDTLPPDDTANLSHALGFPFAISRGLGLWKKLHLSPAPVTDLAGAQVERGRYLVEGAGHCAECHTPRDWTGGLDQARWMAGGPNPEGRGRIPNITPHDDGIGDWLADDIVYYLETGFTPEFDSAGGQMAAVVGNMAQLPAADREAIAAYLKALPPLPDG